VALPSPKAKEGASRGYFQGLISVAGDAVLVSIQIRALTALRGCPASGDTGSAVLGAGDGR